MQATKRSAVRSAQTVRSTARQQRRWAHDAHHDSHAHAHAGPSEEKFGVHLPVDLRNSYVETNLFLYTERILGRHLPNSGCICLLQICQAEQLRAQVLDPRH